MHRESRPVGIGSGDLGGIIVNLYLKPTASCVCLRRHQTSEAMTTGHAAKVQKHLAATDAE
jgi:hypothetical protein